jgi:hypothetical protein
VKALDEAETRLGCKLAASFRESYGEAVDRSDPNDLTLFHPVMFQNAAGGVAVGRFGDDVLVLRGEALFVRDEMVAPSLAELLATDTNGYDATNVVDVVCPFCGNVDAITIDTTGGAHQTFVEDCASCCHPRLVRVEGSDVTVERA